MTRHLEPDGVHPLGGTLHVAVGCEGAGGARAQAGEAACALAPPGCRAAAWSAGRACAARCSRPRVLGSAAASPSGARTPPAASSLPPPPPAVKPNRVSSVGLQCRVRFNGSLASTPARGRELRLLPASAPSGRWQGSGFKRSPAPRCIPWDPTRESCCCSRVKIQKGLQSGCNRVR